MLLKIRLDRSDSYNVIQCDKTLYIFNCQTSEFKSIYSNVIIKTVLVVNNNVIL